MGFGEQLTRLRKRSKLTQTELAEKMGVRQYVVSSWETGRSEPCIRQLIMLGDLFKISIDYLLDKHIIITNNEEQFAKVIENVNLDAKDDFLQSVSSLTNNLSLEKKQKLLKIIEGTIEFSKQN